MLKEISIFDEWVVAIVSKIVHDSCVLDVSINDLYFVINKLIMDKVFCEY